jgi:hypothetical protein
VTVYAQDGLRKVVRSCWLDDDLAYIRAIVADAEMIELPLVCAQAVFDIAQALSPCELREY